MLKRRLGIILGVLLCSTAAWAFPWDIDMSDSPAFKAYEWKMMALPEGTVARNGPTDITKIRRMNIDLTQPGAKDIKDPYAVDDAHLAMGKSIFGTYCQTCHGVDGGGGAPVGDNNPAAGKKRFLVPIPKLTGPGGRATIKTDAEVFYAVRNGKGAMPAYSWALTEQEMWAAVAYLRTIPGGAYVPPTE